MTRLLFVRIIILRSILEQKTPTAIHCLIHLPMPYTHPEAMVRNAMVYQMRRLFHLLATSSLLAEVNRWVQVCLSIRKLVL